MVSRADRMENRAGRMVDKMFHVKHTMTGSILPPADLGEISRIGYRYTIWGEY
jgi:hypothetical protein